MRRFRIAGKSFEVDALSALFRDPKRLAWCIEPLAAGDFENYILRYPRPYRLQCFLEVMDRLSDSQYWRLLAEIWIDAEVPNVNRPIWLDLFTANRGDRQALMTAEEHEAFAALPEVLTIYRATLLKYARGMAWTTDRDQADWFANRWGFPQGQVVIITALPKRKLLAFFNGRKEAEAVINPRRIKYEVLESNVCRNTEANQC